MSEPLPPSETTVIVNAAPVLRVLGCGSCGLGCLALALVLFFVGGVFGVLVFGWKTLLSG